MYDALVAPANILRDVDAFVGPVARVLVAAGEGLKSEPEGSLHALFLLRDAAETLLRFHVLVLLAPWLQGAPHDAAWERSVLLPALSRPSAGDWVHMGKGLARRSSQRGGLPQAAHEAAAWFAGRAAEGGATSQFLISDQGYTARRNRLIGHGATPSRAVVREALESWAQGVAEAVVAAKPLLLRPLLVADQDVLLRWAGAGSPVPMVTSVGLSPGEVLLDDVLLSPFLTWSSCAGSTERHGWFYDRIHRFCPSPPRREAALLEYDEGRTDLSADPVVALERAFGSSTLADAVHRKGGQIAELERTVLGGAAVERPLVIGRAWLHERIDAFRTEAHATGRVVVLSGDPGAGKTAYLLDRWRRSGQVAPTWLFRRQGGVISPEAMSVHLAREAAHRAGLDGRMTLDATSAPSLLFSLLERAAACLPEAEVLEVLVDALDEAAPSRDGQHVVELLPARVPPRVMLLATTRRDVIVDAVAGACGWTRLDLGEHAPENGGDLDHFVRRRLTSAGAPVTDALVHAVRAASGDNFLLAEQGCGLLADASSSLPEGPNREEALLGVIHEAGARLGSGMFAAWWRLRVGAAARGREEASWLAAILDAAGGPVHLDVAAAAGRVARPPVGAWGLQEGLEVLRPYLHLARPLPHGDEVYLRWYHEAFAAFVARQVGPVRRREAHRELAAATQDLDGLPRGPLRSYSLRHYLRHSVDGGAAGEATYRALDRDLLRDTLLELGVDGVLSAYEVVAERDPNVARLVRAVASDTIALDGAPEALDVRLDRLIRSGALQLELRGPPAAGPRLVWGTVEGVEPELVATAGGHDGFVTVLGAGPPEVGFVSGGTDGRVYRRRYRDGRIVTTYMGAPATPTSMHVHADGILVGCSGGQVVAWALDSSGRASWDAHEGAVLWVDGAPDGWSTIGADGRVARKDGQRIQVTDLGLGPLIAATRDARHRIWAVTVAGAVHVMDTEGASLRVWCDLPSPVALASRPGGGMLVGCRGRVVALSPADGERRDLSEVAGQVEALAVDAVSGRVHASTSGKQVLTLDPRTGVVIRARQGHSRGVGAVAVSHDGRTVVSGARDRLVRVFRPTPCSPPPQPAPHEGRVGAVCFAGNLTLSGGHGGTLVWWSAAGEQVGTARAHRGPIRLLLPGDAHVLSACGGGIIHLWDVSSQNVVATAELGANASAGAWDGQGWWVATRSGRVARVEQDGKLVVQRARGSEVTAVAPRGDGLGPVLGGRGGVVELLSADGSTQDCLIVDVGDVFVLEAISRDLVVGGRDRRVARLAPDGTSRWSAPLASPPARLFRAAAGAVLQTWDGNFRWLDLETGTTGRPLCWPEASYSGVALDTERDRLVVGERGGGIVCLEGLFEWLAARPTASG